MNPWAWPKMGDMSPTPTYRPQDLVLFVWSNQRAAEVHAGASTWLEVSQGEWSVAADKADRVTMVVAVDNDTIQEGWRVRGVINRCDIPQAGEREVNRAMFDCVADTQLDYLFGLPSPLASNPRHPQATVPLHNIPGAETLLGQTRPTGGEVELGGYLLTVHSDGSATLRIPNGTIASFTAALSREPHATTAPALPEPKR